MTDYIKREDVINTVVDTKCLFAEDGTTYHKTFDVTNAVSRIPSADVAPVRHGRWNEEKIGCTRVYICSCCGKKYYISPLNDNYCASCGAKMDGE